MWKKLFLFSIVSASASLLAQDIIVTYQYDDYGNCISRKIVVQESIKKEKKSEPLSLSEKLNKLSVKIGPNPTSGQISVEISNVDESDRIDVSIYNISGILIKSANYENQIVQFDLSSQPNGIYLLVVQSNNEQSSWKIIKN